LSNPALHRCLLTTRLRARSSPLSLTLQAAELKLQLEALTADQALVQQFAEQMQEQLQAAQLPAPQRTPQLHEMEAAAFDLATRLEAVESQLEAARAAQQEEQVCCLPLVPDSFL
jgi:chromosome segregation ATPase